MSNPRLFLIDGHALVFKMFYAFYTRPMVNSKGEDTSILFGFTKYLLELIEKQQPTHIAVSFDPPGGTFRNKMYEPYKANRPPTPPLVIAALEPLTKIVKALNIPVLMEMGFEADDVIGSMAKRSAKEGADVFMVTPDKDYGQLIEDHIWQIKPGKGGGDDEIIGVTEICEKYGIEDPMQVVEVLTICGDSADNVPGVKGVGEVGAKKLLSKYHSVKGIYEHIDELTPKQKLMFEESKGHIDLSHDLVTIKTDMDLSTTLEDMALDKNYSSEIVELFNYYEFGSLKKYISHVSANPSSVEEAKKEKKPFTVVKTTPERVCQAAYKTGKCSIVLYPTPKSIFTKFDGITVASASGEEYLSSYAPISSFKGILEDASIEKIGYNLKLVSNVLFNDGVTLNGKFSDIELMHYLTNPERSHSVDILAPAYLDISLEEEKTEEAPSNEGLLFGLGDEDNVQAQKDCSKEAAVLIPLSGKVREEMVSSSCDGLYDTMEEPLIRVLGKMECSGVKVDMAPLRAFASDLQKEILQREKTIREMAEEPTLNISSPKQLGVVLFEKLALDPKAKKNTNGSWKTDEDTLVELSDRHPIINEILEFRKAKKLLSTYIEPFGGYVSEVTGKVHTTFNQALTSTGRLSSSNPNLQNIPIRTERGKEIRKAFVASNPGGVIMSADYSQIELRIMAHLSCDQHLISSFRSGVDVHKATASKIFGIPVEEVTSDQRRIAKTANFGIMYGISSFGLAKDLRIANKEAKKIIDDYFESFPAIKSFINDTLEAARENGYVETLFGRRRYIPDIKAKNGSVRALAERNAVNAPIQGTSADIIKLAMIGVDKAMAEAGLKSKMVLQIHDELVFDVLPEEIESLQKIVIEQMENVISLSIPLTVECNYGTNWLEAH